MNLRIAARHFDLEEDVREHAEKRVLPLKRFFDGVTDADLVLNVEKHRKFAELTLHLVGGPITAKSETTDFFESIDKVTAKMERQLKKRKDLIQNHRGPNHVDREQILSDMDQEIY